jgi:hypothetical protein
MLRSRKTLNIAVLDLICQVLCQSGSAMLMPTGEHIYHLCAFESDRTLSWATTFPQFEVWRIATFRPKRIFRRKTGSICERSGVLVKVLSHWLATELT